MFDMPDWYRKYQSKDAWGNATGGTPAAALSTGLNNAAPAVPPQVTQGGNYNDVDNVPYDPMSGPNNSSLAMRGAPVSPPVARTPMPASPPLPPQAPGGNYATTAALEGDPAGQPYWAPQAQQAAASEDRQVGPGSWFDPSKMGRMVDPNSLIGKLMSMRNTSPAPKAEQPQQGLLAPLFQSGGLFG